MKYSICFAVLAALCLFATCKKEVIVIEPCEEVPTPTDSLPPQPFNTVFNVAHQTLNGFACVEPKAYVIRTLGEFNDIVSGCSWQPSPVDFDNYSILANTIVALHDDFLIEEEVKQDTLLKRFYFTYRLRQWEGPVSQPLIETRYTSWIRVPRIPTYYEVYFEEAIVYPKMRYQ
jgi:hypothetical protein